MSKAKPDSAPRKPGRPRSQRARRAILAAAHDILTEKGFGRVTVEAVAGRAGVGKPTIYRYWANARELAMAALMEHTPPADAAAEDGGDPLARLSAQLAAMSDRFGTPAGRQVALMMASADSGSELARSFRNQILLTSRNAGRVLLEEAVAAGQLRADLLIETALDLVYGPLFYRLLTGHGPVDPAFCQEVLATALSGFRPRGA